MATIQWDQALQGAAPITGGQPLPSATYRLRAVAGEGKLNSNNAVMLSLQFEVESGPLKGRKQFHNENLPNGNTDQDKQRMGFFLGLMEAFGITGAMLGQWFAGRAVDVETIDYLAKQLVASGRVIKGTVRPQKNDPSRVNVGGWSPDDGIEPEPPKQVSAAPATPAGPPAPGMPGAGGGFPAPGAPQGAPAPSGLPLGGFPGSGQAAPNPAPQWSQQPTAQPQAQQLAGPGQAAPAAQPQAAGLNQFAQPAAGQFPGQQFQGQVDPANFPPQGQQQAAPAGPPAQHMPGMPGPAQQAPGGFPAPTGAPQANF